MVVVCKDGVSSSSQIAFEDRTNIYIHLWAKLFKILIQGYVY